MNRPVVVYAAAVMFVAGAVMFAFGWALAGLAMKELLDEDVPAHAVGECWPTGWPNGTAAW